jgi:hypothetical protein
MRVIFRATSKRTVMAMRLGGAEDAIDDRRYTYARLLGCKAEETQAGGGRWRGSQWYNARIFGLIADQVIKRFPGAAQAQ